MGLEKFQNPAADGFILQGPLLLVIHHNEIIMESIDHFGFQFLPGFFFTCYWDWKVHPVWRIQIRP